MPERAIDRRRREDEDRERDAPEPALRQAEPVLALQRTAGNHAVARLLARAPAGKGATGDVELAGIGKIKVSGGNLEEWTEKGAVFSTVEVTSQKGRHSTKLEKLSKAGTKMDVKVSISAAQKEGEELNVGGGTMLSIKDAHVENYAVDDGVETWRLAGFEDVKRTKVTRKVS